MLRLSELETLTILIGEVESEENSLIFTFHFSFDIVLDTGGTLDHVRLAHVNFSLRLTFCKI